MPDAEVTPRVPALPRFSVALSAAAVLVVGAVAFPSPVPLGAVVLGGLLVALGLRRFAERWLALGAAVLFVAVVLAAPPSPGWFLAATVPVVLAWTAARYALRIGRQVGRAGSTLRVELVNAVLTLTVLVVGGGVGYVGSRVVVGSDSVLSVGLLFVAVVLFTVALRRS